MVRTQIQLEESQIEWLRSKAKSKNVSVSHLIREGIDLYRSREDRFPAEKKKRALEAVGQYFSGLSDVSARHDEYLADAFGKRGQ